MERLLTPREAAQYMAVTPRTVKEWLRRGDLTGLKVKNMWRIRTADLEKFIKKGEDGAASRDSRNGSLRGDDDNHGGWAGSAEGGAESKTGGKGPLGEGRG